MKRIHLLAGTVAALVLVACGGSGSGNSNNGSTTTPSSTPRIEAVVVTPTTNDNGSLSNGQTFIIQDPNDIEAQDQVQFELVSYSSTGQRIVLPAAQWTTSDTANVFGTLSYNSGVLTVSRSETQTPQVVSVTYNGAQFSTTYSILPRQVRLRGVLVSADGSHTPVAGVEIDFYGPQNPSDPTSPEIFQGRVSTAYDGSFRASVPLTTNHFTLVNNTLPTQYKRFFEYNGVWHNTGDTDCLATINIPEFASTSGLPTLNGEYFLIDYTNSNVATNGTILLSATNQTPTCGN